MREACVLVCCPSRLWSWKVMVVGGWGPWQYMRWNHLYCHGPHPLTNNTLHDHSLDRQQTSTCTSHDTFTLHISYMGLSHHSLTLHISHMATSNYVISHMTPSHNISLTSSSNTNTGGGWAVMVLVPVLIMMPGDRLIFNKTFYLCKWKGDLSYLVYQHCQ